MDGTTTKTFTEVICAVPDYIHNFLSQSPEFLYPKCIKIAFDFLGDALSNIVLTICCVILLSYLRQAVPKLKVTPRFIRILTLPALSGLLQRFTAKLENPSGVPHFEKALLGLMELLNGELSFHVFLQEYSASILLTIIPTATAFLCICTAALKIMEVHKKKHTIPMIGFIIVCIAIRFCLEKPYDAFMGFIFDDVLNISLSFGSESITLLAYNLFIYGSIMLIAMITYMYHTMQKKGKFRKGLPHILYFLGFIVFYTVFNICANAGKLTSVDVDPIAAANNNIKAVIIGKSVILLFSFILTFTLMVFFLAYGIKKPYRLIQADVKNQNRDDERKEDAKSYNRGNKEIDKFNHDLPNNLTMIEETASNENAVKTAELVHALLENLIKARKGFVSGNDFLDTVLYRENEKAKAAGIEIKYDGIFPEKGIEIFDISTIFCNALDNAIEACSEVEELSSIDFVSRIKGDYVYFKIINPYKTIKTDKKNNLISTKEDTKSHGFGLKNIKEAIKKYDGTMDVTYEKNIFTLSAKLRYKNTEE